jgi:hypothetical protein
VRTQDHDDTYRPAPHHLRGAGGKWKGRGGRRLRNEGRRDDREQDRGGKSDMHLAPRDLDRLLAAEAWSEGDDGAVEPEDLEEGDTNGRE